MILSGTMEYVVFAAITLLITLAVVAKFWKVRSARKLSLYTTLGLIALLIGGVKHVQNAEDSERTRVRSLLEGFAPTYATEMEHLGHWKLNFQTPADDPIYLSAIEAEKRWLKANPGVADVYTFRKTADGKLGFIVDSETDYDHSGKYDSDRETRTAIGEIYDEESDLINDAFAGKAGFQEEPYTDRWGTWISAAVPLHAPDGTIEGVLGVDYPAAAWLADLRKERRQHMAQVGIIAILLIASLIVICLQHRGLEEKHRTAELLEQQKEDLKQAHDRANEANQAKSQFVKSISQQLRSPLQSMLETAELLSDQDAPAADRANQLQVLHRNGEHLLSIVDDLLDLGQIESGHLNFEVGDVNVPQLLEEVASMVTPRLVNQTFAIQYQTPIHRSLRTDGKRLRQVLLNLIENASKLGNCTGVELALSLNGPRLRVDVRSIQAKSDQCAYIPDIEGQSLGLKLSIQLARMLGGTLKIPTNPETPFGFELPANPSGGSNMVNQRPLMSSAAARITIGENANLAGLRILVADDSPESLKLIQFLLKGADVEVVANGRDAVGHALMSKIENRPFDVILLDTDMPVMDGMAAASTIREKGYLYPLLAMTAESSAADRTRCQAHGFNDVIAKPLNRRDLLEKIQMIVKRRKAA